MKFLTFLSIKTLLVVGSALLHCFIAILLLAHLTLTRNYFNGSPTQDIANGQTALWISLASSMITVYFALFLHFTDRRSFTLFCGLYIGFTFSILTSFAVIYFFREGDPAPEKIQEYFAKYFKAHRKPPPFFDRIQHLMNGYCCGGISYLDYVAHTKDIFAVPRSCCFAQLKQEDIDCGGSNWKYLYNFLTSSMPEILLNLEKNYGYLEDLEEVVKDVAMRNSMQFVDSNYKAMMDDRIASITSNSTGTDTDSITYQRILEDALATLQNSVQDDMNAYVSGRVFEEATQEVAALIEQFTDPWAITFFPMGCWTLLSIMRKSNWKGFNELSEVKEKVTFLVQGAFAMSCLYAATVIIFVVTFYATVILGCCNPSSQSRSKSKPSLPEDTDKVTVGDSDVEKETEAINKPKKPNSSSSSAIKTKGKRGASAKLKQIFSDKISKRTFTPKMSNKKATVGIQVEQETEVSDVENTNTDTEDDELHKLLSARKLKDFQGVSSDEAGQPTRKSSISKP